MSPRTRASASRSMTVMRSRRNDPLSAIMRSSIQLPMTYDRHRRTGRCLAETVAVSRRAAEARGAMPRDHGWPAGGYVPTVRGGGKMRVRMTCLGRHWNPLTYKYVSTRADYDDAPVPPVPAEWVALASRIAADAGFAATPDICLINWYGPEGRMGLHQDKDESPEGIRAGLPVVSHLARRYRAIPVRRPPSSRSCRGVAARVG